MYLTKNENLKRLPLHLHKYVVNQNYANYTPEDHAVWRYMMRISFDFLAENAHQSFVEGLKQTGICFEKIPNIDEINSILEKIGWAAVCVDGFIPPTVFMEFQAYHVLVIAADIRSIGHIEYTPAPDIFHEAAGHAPIIADAEYAEYLRLFGAIGSKAISSKRDNDLYEAIRRLSIVKENRHSTAEEISEAELQVVEIQRYMGEMSEMSKIRNLHWWTVEYGLIGEFENPKLYGAGLLSSIGESVNCLSERVIKLPYTIEAADKSFDITTQQPQLFVTPNFTHLTIVLNEFADTMALRLGGAKSVQKAIDSEAEASVELSSGLQISGIFTRMILDEQGEIAYLKTTGPSMLCERERVMIGHGVNVHTEGFGTPIGLLKNMQSPLENMSLQHLAQIGIITGLWVRLDFQSGVCVEGKLKYIRKNKYGKVLLMTFVDCTVRFNDEILFQPEWGVYDMAVGKQVTSVFAGLADKNEAEAQTYVSDTFTQHAMQSDAQLMRYYQEIRDFRIKSKGDSKLTKLYQKVMIDYPDNWLLSIEIYELAIQLKIAKLASSIKTDLLGKVERFPQFATLILNGIRIIENH